MVRSAAPWWWCSALVVGDSKRRRTREHSRRVAKTSERTGTVLGALSGRADRPRRLLGDSQPQHSGLHAIREEPALAGSRSGVGTSNTEDRVTVRWGCSD